MSRRGHADGNAEPELIRPPRGRRKGPQPTLRHSRPGRRKPTRGAHPESEDPRPRSLYMGGCGRRVRTTALYTAFSAGPISPRRAQVSGGRDASVPTDLPASGDGLLLVTAPSRDLEHLVARRRVPSLLGARPAMQEPRPFGQAPMTRRQSILLPTADANRWRVATVGFISPRSRRATAETEVFIRAATSA